MNELHVVVIVSQVPEFVCKQLRKTVSINTGDNNKKCFLLATNKHSNRMKDLMDHMILITGVITVVAAKIHFLSSQESILKYI